jgi:hypothetical protein
MDKLKALLARWVFGDAPPLDLLSAISYGHSRFRITEVSLDYRHAERDPWLGVRPQGVQLSLRAEGENKKWD